MQHRCTACKEVFDVPEGDRPRCPKCLRIHDVVAIEKPSSKVSRNRGPIIFFLIIAVSAGAYGTWYWSQGEEETDEEVPVQIGPLSVEDLRSHLKRRHVKQSELVVPFESSKEVETFAREATHGAASVQEKAQALLEAIRGLLDENNELYVSIAPRAISPLSPTKTLERLQGEEAFTPYSYELAALMVAGCRAVDVPAVLAEVYQFEATKRPADASGTQGYFAAAIPRGEGSSYRRPVFYDPASGRAGDSAAGEADVLTDLEAVSALLTLKALDLVARSGDRVGAERFATLAVRLRPGGATARAARGTVRMLAGTSELELGAALEDYEQALRNRPDPQRKVLVARILLAMNQPARAEELVRSALTDADEFAAAHGLMGVLHVARQNFEEAQASLDQAERLEPRDPHIALLWVQYHIGQQDLLTAAEVARAVVDRVPDDPQPRLLLAQVLYQDARYGAAEEQFRELLRRNPDNSQLREVLRQMFEYDPDEAELAEVGDAGPAVAAAETDGGWDDVISGDASAPLQLQMGKGLGKVRLGGPSGFQLNPITP